MTTPNETPPREFWTPRRIAKFESKIATEPMCGCWLWLGDFNQYGRIQVDRTNWLAHRAAWTIYRCDIPRRMYVLHRCDTPACVNPAHLFLGTNDDNVADRVMKGRTKYVTRHGDAHPLRKLSSSDVIAIRMRHQNGERGCDLSAEYGVRKSTISDIVNNKMWRSIA